MNREITENDDKIGDENTKTQALNGKLGDLDSDKNKLRVQYETLQKNYIQEKDEPVRLEKGNQNHGKAVEKLVSDLNSLKEDIEN